jgi:ribosome-associated protein
MRQNLAEVMRQDQDILEVSAKIVNACADAKGKDITVLNASKVSDLFSYVVIVSGRSDRQVQGISNKVLESLEKQGLRPLSLEGSDQGHWIVIDYGDIVVHVFFEPLRSHYNLEGLLAQAKPVRIVKGRKASQLALRPV